jgi:SsrA-binding protein
MGLLIHLGNEAIMSSRKIIAKNRKAHHEYHIMERFEAGLVLKGTEVKSLRDSQMTLKDSYGSVRAGELFLVGAHISPYDKGNINNHDPERPRKLLMHKRQIIKLSVQIAEKGLTLIPLSVYFSKGKAKVEMGLGRGKQAHDKRHAIREREVKREMAQAARLAEKS